MKVKLSSSIIDSIRYFSRSGYINIKNDRLRSYDVGRVLSYLSDRIDYYGFIEVSKGLGVSNVNEIGVGGVGDRIKISYITREKGENFYQMKVRKFLKLFFDGVGLRVTDLILEDIIPYFIGIDGFINFLSYNNLKVVIDKNFNKSYFISNYVAKKGSLGSSCMNDVVSVPYFYYSLSDKVSIVRIEDSSGRVWGRCLLWETNKGLYLDRFYFINDLIFPLFYLYMHKFYNINLNYLAYEFIVNDTSMYVEIDINSILNKLEFLSETNKISKLEIIKIIKDNKVSLDTMVLSFVDLVNKKVYIYPGKEKDIEISNYNLESTSEIFDYLIDLL